MTQFRIVRAVLRHLRETRDIAAAYDRVSADTGVPKRDVVEAYLTLKLRLLDRKV